VGVPRRPGGGSLDALIVGLGNPGAQYARTRHNVGFKVVDRLAERAGASLRGKYNGLFTETTVADARVGLLEPQTFMNLSGQPAAAAARFYKLDPTDVIVVYDEIELDFDQVRARAGGGLKGHNGLRSMAQALGSPDFLRVRCGVGRPRRGDPRGVADYVLAPFYDDEDPTTLIERAAGCVEAILTDGIEAAERAYARG
jgi:PTH1 family peptidyl-tRNA hydrolase